MPIHLTSNIHNLNVRRVKTPPLKNYKKAQRHRKQENLKRQTLCKSKGHSPPGANLRVQQAHRSRHGEKNQARFIVDSLQPSKSPLPPILPLSATLQSTPALSSVSACSTIPVEPRPDLRDSARWSGKSTRRISLWRLQSVSALLLPLGVRTSTSLFISLDAFCRWPDRLHASPHPRAVAPTCCLPTFVGVNEGAQHALLFSSQCQLLLPSTYHHFEESVLNSGFTTGSDSCVFSKSTIVTASSSVNVLNFRSFSIMFRRLLSWRASTKTFTRLSTC